MLNESDIIRKISRFMPGSPLQMNGIFESDSEIIEHNGDFWLFNIDEFSREDRFCEKIGYNLGWNVSVGALSDIFASGGMPEFFGCSLTVNRRFDEKYTLDFAQGMADALNKAGVSFIGGDFGKAKEWRATCFVFGRTEKPIKRSGAKIGDNIFITGKIGSGNLQAVGIPSRFELRTCPKGATACIDTSDGLWNGINTIAEQSRVGFELFDIPYYRKIPIRQELLMFCECGEYELLLTSPLELDLLKIGKITHDGKFLNGKDISGFDIHARNYWSIAKYIMAVIKKCAELL